MNQEQTEQMEQIAESIDECWTRIKSKARAEGHITNIERYSPCLTSALNEMENFLVSLNE